MEGTMKTLESSKTTGASLTRDLLHAARYYLGSRWALVAIALVVAAGGIALNWSWLVAAGIAPVLLTLLPCAVMCGLGLCMNKLVGSSCATQPAQSDAKVEQTEASIQAKLTAPEPDHMWERSEPGDISSGASASSAPKQSQPYDERREPHA